MAQTEETEKPVEAPKRSMMPIIMAVNMLVTVGILGVVVMQMRKPPAAHVAGGEGKAEAASEKGEKSEKSEAAGGEKGHGGVSMKLGEFTVRLRNPETDRYAKMVLEVEVATEQDKEVVTAHLPQIRDSFIAYLSDRTVEDLRGANGLEQTKQALSAKLKEASGGAKLGNLFITDFITQ